MPKKCCVPNCKTNLNPTVFGISTKGTCFSFPKDENLAQKWIRSIPRKDEINTKNAGVCSLHFDERKIIFFRNVGGQNIRLKKPHLMEDAIPTIFGNLPAYYSKTVVIRSDPENRKLFAINLKKQIDEAKQIEAEKSDKIENFFCITDKYKAKLNLNNDWNVKVCDNDVYIYSVNLDSSNGNLFIKVNININKNLIVKVFVDNNEKSLTDLQCIVPNDFKISSWSQITKLINLFTENLVEEQAPDEKIKRLLMYANNNLLKIQNIEGDDFEFEYKNNVNIIIDQILQMLRKNKKYSSNTILCAYLLYLQSSSCYKIIRNQNILILPHEKTLQKIELKQDVNPKNSNSNLSYLKKIVSNLTDIEKKVNIQIDEIYVHCQLNYKANTISGFSENTKEIAKTVVAYMVSSCFGSMKEIARLVPTFNPTGKDLYENTFTVLNELQILGLEIVSIITDNHKINQNMFLLFQPDFSYKFNNPKFENSEIFLLFDSVHIAKIFRNNWLNKKDSSKTFIYPDFDDFSLIRQAKFKDLQQLHNSESNLLIKQAPNLNKKTLYPNSFERQKVSLLMNILDEKTISALRYSSTEYLGTATFLEIIRKWFSIMNNRSTVKGIIKRDKWMSVITNEDSYHIEFLKRFVSWLEKLKSIGQDGGLTKETFNSAIVATNGIIRIIDVSFKKFKINFFLPGKFQTEDLERRFGRYRNLSGCNFAVSYKDILESEKKLRIRRLVKNYADELFLSHYSNTVKNEINLEDFDHILQEIVEYAAKIGINPESEPHLLYLAKEGLVQALPIDWKICYNEVLHAHYYYNENTKIAQWEHPLDDVYRQFAEQVRQSTKATTPNSVLSDEGSQLDSGIKSQGNEETDTKDKMEKFPRSLKKINEKDENSANILSPKLFPHHVLCNKPKNTFISQLQLHSNVEKESNNQNHFRLSGTGAKFLKSNSRIVENGDYKGLVGEKKTADPIEQNFKGILRDTHILETKRNDDEIHILAADEKKSVRFNLNDTQTKITELPKTDQQFISLQNVNSDDNSECTYNKKENFEENIKCKTKLIMQDNLTLSTQINLQNIGNSEIKNVKSGNTARTSKTDERSEKPAVRLHRISDLEICNNDTCEKENTVLTNLYNNANRLYENFEENMKGESINKNENEVIVLDQLKIPSPKIVQMKNTIITENWDINKHTEIIKLNYEEKLRVMQSHYDAQLQETKYNFEKANNLAIEKLKERLSEDLEKSRNEVLTNHKIAMNLLQKNHSEILEELERDLKSEEVLIRKEHSNKLKDMKENLNEEFKIEKQKMKETGEDRLFEKVRCEKRLLEDKYKCLKEKYIRLKTDVRLSLERRNRRREQIAKNHQSITTASETEKSVSNKLSFRNNSEVNSMSLSTSYPDHYQLDKTPNIIKPYVTDQIEKPSKKLNISSKYIKQLQVQYNDDTTSLSYSDTTISNKDGRSKLLQDHGNTSAVQHDFFLAKEFDNDQAENNNNNQRDCSKTKYNKMKSTKFLNECLKIDRSSTPVENLRQQLQTLDDMEDLFPDNALDSYHLRYPFADSARSPATNSTELEFFKHRIHLERETLRRAKESLRNQRTNFRIRQRDIKQKYKVLSSTITLEQLTQEEKELAEIEVNLHRTRSLLGEKVIRLRHLEKSIRIISEKQKPLKNFFDDHKEDATLSDLSSHSSSGFSSNDLGSNTNTFLNRQKELSTTSSDAIQNLEILNTEIYEILDLLKKKNISELFKTSDVNWLGSSPNFMSSSTSNNATNFFNVNSAFGERSENCQNYCLTSSMLTASPTAISYTSNLVERVRDLKNWLTQAKIDYDMVLANNFRLTFDRTGNTLDLPNIN